MLAIWLSDYAADGRRPWPYLYSINTVAGRLTRCKSGVDVRVFQSGIFCFGVTSGQIL